MIFACNEAAANDEKKKIETYKNNLLLYRVKEAIWKIIS
jgi:hypothetical protein